VPNSTYEKAMPQALDALDKKRQAERTAKQRDSIIDSALEMMSPSRFNRDLPPDYKNPDPRLSVDLPQGYTNPDPKMNRFKKGGKASNSKEHDWHGFGGSKTGKHNHGF